MSVLRGMVCGLILVALVAPVQAQVLYGTLLGSIVDPSQSAVPKATVTATNKARGLVKETTSDERGFYAFRDLVEGVYDLSVTAQGFAPYTRTGLDIRVNATTRADVALSVGAVAEAVTVTANIATLQTDKADVRAEITFKEVSNLPLPAYRNYQSLINLVPGSTPARFQNAITDTPARALTTNINGTSRNAMNTRIDGATSVHSWLPHHTHYIPTPESIETVNVSTGSFDAEQGLAGGAAITVATKSGTNTLHGAVFDFFDNHKLGAKNYFFRDKNRPKNIMNQYGAVISGPIVRDKLFFLGSWEAMKQRRNYGTLATVSTAAQRAGDFSNVGALGIYNPDTGTPDGRGRARFDNNTIPLSSQSAIARQIQALVPLPNQAGFASNFFAAVPLVYDRDDLDTKVNWNISSRTTMFGAYSIMLSPVTCPGILGEAVGRCGVSGGGDSAGVGTGNNKTQVVRLGINHTLTPTLLIDGNFGYTRMHHDTADPNSGKNIGLDVLKIPGTNGPDIRQSGFPIFAVSGYESIGTISAWIPVERNDRVYTYVANAGWTKGAHNLRWGVDLIRHEMNHWQPEEGGWSPRGAFNFSGGTTSLVGGPAVDRFNSYASFLLGLMSSHGKAIQFYDPMKTREWQHGYYVRDQWQATRNLTVTLGLRYEYFAIMNRGEFGIERYDFDTDQMRLGGRGNVPRNNDIVAPKTMFRPRVGLAYRLGQKTVVRAGYGVTNDPYPFSRPMRSLFPAVIRNEYSQPQSFLPSGRLENGIPPTPAFDISSGVVNIPKNFATRTVTAGTFDRGYIQSWNFTVQREMPGKFTGQVGYVGTLSIRQALSYFDTNAGILPGRGINGRPLYLKHGRTNQVQLFAPMATNNYHAMQVKVDRRFAQGFFTTLAYTWSKTMGINGGNSDSGLDIYIPDQMYRNRGVAGFDRTHNLASAWIYELPFGKGKRYLSGNRVASALAGGWQINGSFAAFTGQTFTVTAPGTSLNAPGTTQLADQVLPTVKKLGGVDVGNPFYDRSAYRAVTEVRMGTSALRGLRGPGAVNIDLSVFRKFPVTERVNVEFRAESFNFTNTPHFENPNGAVTDQNFMIITSALQDQRVIRFGLRVGF